MMRSLSFSPVAAAALLQCCIWREQSPTHIAASQPIPAGPVGRPRRRYKWPLSWCGHSVRQRACRTPNLRILCCGICSAVSSTILRGTIHQRPELQSASTDAPKCVTRDPTGPSRPATDAFVSRTNSSSTNPNDAVAQHALYWRLVLAGSFSCSLHSTARSCSANKHKHSFCSSSRAWRAAVD